MQPARNDTLGYIIAIAAVLLGTLNVVGGWVVTDRMLQMFRRRPAADAHKPETPIDTGGSLTTMQPSALTTLGYMLTAVSFMFGIQLLRSPATARTGNRVAAVGMLLVLGITFALIHNTGNWPLIIPPIIIGAAIGAVSARLVRMTAMPQMVALFNGMGGGSAALSPRRTSARPWRT